MTLQVFYGHSLLYCLKIHFYRSKKRGKLAGGTIRSHYNPNDLTKKTSSKLNKDVINQNLYHSEFLICSVQIISTSIDGCHITYNPSLPNFSNVIKKYFPILIAMKRGKEAFKDPPLLAYRCPRSLLNFLVKAKLKISSQANRTLSGTISRRNDNHCRTCKSSLMVHCLTLFTTPENKGKSYKTYPALLTTLYT